MENCFISGANYVQPFLASKLFNKYIFQSPYSMVEFGEDLIIGTVFSYGGAKEKIILAVWRHMHNKEQLIDDRFKEKLREIGKLYSLFCQLERSKNSKTVLDEFECSNEVSFITIVRSNF